jgi:hypothetical protein
MADNGTWIPSTGTITPDSPTNASAVVFYNELATLMLNTGRMQLSSLLQLLFTAGTAVFFCRSQHLVSPVPDATPC